MKSISDILNSMVQPTDQNSLLAGNQSASPQGANSSVGSFSDVLSRLTAQNSNTANASSDTSNNNTTTNSGAQNTGLANFSDTQMTVTEVQVSENVQSNSLSQTTLTNIENAATAMAMALAKLVNLASNLQTLNPTQAQNLLVSASGGALSASQAQQLVAQISALKNQNNGQNPLSLTPDQQNALLLQMMQSMVQNQQVTLTSSADTQTNQNSLSNTSQGSTLLQFNFAGNQSGQNGNAQLESLSINIQTFDLQASSINQQSQGASLNPAPSTNLTDATTQRLTQLLQQLNVMPSSTPVNVQIQSSVLATNSPELAQNFQNLVQILTQAGAGQAVLSTSLTQQKNDAANNNLQLTLNQQPQTQNGTAVQSVSVTALDSTNSANSALISNGNQNNPIGGQAQLLNDSLDNQNIELTAQNPTSQTATNSPQSGSATANGSAVTNTAQNPPAPISNNRPQPIVLAETIQVSLAPVASTTAQTVPVQLTNNEPQTTTPVVTNTAQSLPIQPTNNQPQTTTPIVTNTTQTLPIQPTNNQPQTTTPVVTNTSQNLPIQSTGNQPQTTTPIVTNTVQNVPVQTTNNQPQATTPVINTAQTVPVQTADNQPQTTAPIVTNAGQNLPIQPTNNQPQTTAPVVTNTTQNVSIQPTNDQPQLTTPIVTNTAQNLPIQQTNNQTQTTVPVVTNTAQTVLTQPANNQPQTTSPVVNVQAIQPPVATIPGQNNTNQTAANFNNQTTLSQPQAVFANGQVEVVNNAGAGFNSAVVSGQALDANSINIKNNINQFPTETQAQNQPAPVQPTAPVQTAVALTAPAETTVNIALNNQNTQQANNLTGNNVQSQLVQPTSPTTQQVANVINVSEQNSFVQTAANTTANNTANTTAGPAVINTNNSPATPALQGAPVAAAVPELQPVVTSNQATIVAPTSAVASSPVVTQPVTTPASITSQNVLAATMAGETAKASVPPQVQSNVNNNNNAPVVTAVSSVSAVQPVGAEAITQTSNTSESSTNLNTSANSAKDTLSDTTNLQNLASSVNAGMTTTADRAGNSFQTTVNTVANNNPNGSVDSAQILNQINQQVASQTADAKMVSRLNFQLVPESLGRVNIQVALVDQSISARITVTNPDVREVLQQHMVDLKAALSQAGLQIDQMQVQVQGGGANLLSQYYQYQQEGNSYRESAWVPTAPTEQPQTADNSGALVTAGSGSTLNLLV